MDLGKGALETRESQRDLFTARFKSPSSFLPFVKQFIFFLFLFLQKTCYLEEEGISLAGESGGGDFFLRKFREIAVAAFSSVFVCFSLSSSFERGDWILIPLRKTGWEEGMEEGSFLGNQSVLYGGVGVAHPTESLTIDFQCRAELKVCSGLFSFCISQKQNISLKCVRFF